MLDNRIQLNFSFTSSFWIDWSHLYHSDTHLYIVTIIVIINNSWTFPAFG